MMYQLKKGVLVLVLLSSGLAVAGPCEEGAFSDPESFAKAMTEGLILREGQDRLMELYIRGIALKVLKILFALR